MLGDMFMRVGEAVSPYPIKAYIDTEFGCIGSGVG